MCTAFFPLCSREECFAHDYLDTLQKNKALHYEKGSHSFTKKCKKSRKMWNKYKRKEFLYKIQLHENPHKLWRFQRCDEVMQSGRLRCLEEWRSPTCSPHVVSLSRQHDRLGEVLQPLHSFSLSPSPRFMHARSLQVRMWSGRRGNAELGRQGCRGIFSEKQK